MSSQQIPPMAAQAFLKTTWNAMEKEELEKNLMQALIDDPEIGDSTNITVNFDPFANSNKGKIELLGKVDSELDKNRAEEIAKVNTKNEVEILNNLNVK